MVLEVKNLPANAGDVQDVGSVLGLGRSPGEGHGKPLQYSCLENSMDRGAWWAIVLRVTKSWTRLMQLTCTCTLSTILNHCSVASEYWSGWLLPSPGALPNPGTEPGSPALQADSLPAELWGNHQSIVVKKHSRYLPSAGGYRQLQIGRQIRYLQRMIWRK